jgi:hypothetical protein
MAEKGTSNKSGSPRGGFEKKGGQSVVGQRPTPRGGAQRPAPQPKGSGK